MLVKGLQFKGLVSSGSRHLKQTLDLDCKPASRGPPSIGGSAKADDIERALVSKGAGGKRRS
jgi:hypothetical protein